MRRRQSFAFHVNLSTVLFERQFDFSVGEGGVVRNVFGEDAEGSVFVVEGIVVLVEAFVGGDFGCLDGQIALEIDGSGAAETDAIDPDIGLTIGDACDLNGAARDKDAGGGGLGGGIPGGAAEDSADAEVGGGVFVGMIGQGERDGAIFEADFASGGGEDLDSDQACSIGEVGGFPFGMDIGLPDGTGAGDGDTGCDFDVGIGDAGLEVGIGDVEGARRADAVSDGVCPFGTLYALFGSVHSQTSLPLVKATECPQLEIWMIFVNSVLLGSVTFWA